MLSVNIEYIHDEHGARIPKYVSEPALDECFNFLCCGVNFDCELQFHGQTTILRHEWDLGLAKEDVDSLPCLA